MTPVSGAGALVSAVLAWAGAAVAWRRLGPGSDADPAASGPPPSISVIVPARNEAATLPLLLASLRAVSPPPREVIVVDDGSTDGTAGVAARFGARVIAGRPLPPGWTGKNWACQQGAESASGDLLLFTDADTIHRPDGPARAAAFLASRNADLVSAMPYHRAPTVWERALGPFHALVLVATAHRTPRRGRLYAIGQFLLFRRTFYERIGGHASVAGRYPDDLALADRTLDAGGRFAFHAGRPFFDVRMYDHFSSFIDGWRRNIAAGLRLGRPAAAIEVTLVVAALLAGGRPEGGALTWAPALLTAGVIALRQRTWGEFSLWGVVLYPFSLAVYTLVTAGALLDLLRGGRLHWKDRTLTGWAAGERK